MKPEKRRLLADQLKEHVKYLEELGVSELDFAVSDGSDKPQTQTGNIVRSELPSELQDMVGELRIAKPDVAAPRAPRSGSLLGSTKISGVSANPSSRKRVSSQIGTEKEQIKEIEPMTEKLDSLPVSDETLTDIQKEIGADCKLCELCNERTQVVNSVGSETADLMIIGEAPGADEDQRGEPFVGRAGKLLTKILEAIDFERKDVFIGNINRCRPPKNRQPTPEESAACKPFLIREIAAVRPKVIVVLGNTATRNLLDTKTGITKLRGKFAEYYGVKVMPTFHPAYLLRDPRKKREVWEDMKLVRDYINSQQDAG